MPDLCMGPQKNEEKYAFPNIYLCASRKMLKVASFRKSKRFQMRKNLFVNLVTL